MVINWPKLPANPLVTFFSSQAGNPQMPDACYTYCDNGMLYRWDTSGASTSALGAANDIPGVNRVIFPNNTPARGAFLVGFPVIGTGKESHAKFKPGSLRIESAIRCLLLGTHYDGDSNFGEKVEIVLEFDAERMSHFWLRHSYTVEPGTQIDLLAPTSKGAQQKTLESAISDLANGKTSPPYLGSGSGGLDESSSNEIFTERSRVLCGLINHAPGKSTINANPPEDLWASSIELSRRSLTVSFLETTQGSGEFVIQFEAQFENPPVYDASGNLLACLAIGAASQSEEQARFDLIGHADNDHTWSLKQRSSVASCKIGSRSELETVLEWVLELSCLTHESVADHAYKWVEAGIQGIQGFAGASGASFIPRLLPPETKEVLVFSAVYLIGDRSMVRAYSDPVLFDRSQGLPQGKTAVYPFSVEFIGFSRISGNNANSIGNAVLQFPLCESIDRKPLEMNIALTSPSLEMRETQEGFLFSSGYALTGPATPIQVRMGSLEVGFGQRGQPTASLSYFHLYDQGTGSGPQLSVSAAFTVTRLLPGGQDDLPEDSFFAPNAVAAAMPKCRTGGDPLAGITNPSPDQTEDVEVEHLFYRPRPLLINRAQSNNDVPLLLTVAESSGPSVNRTAYFSLDVDNKSSVPLPPTSPKQQTIVLDSDPFLVAQLTFPSLLSQAGAAHIAVWDNSSGNGAKWQIPLTKSGFSLSLPALALGEEMIKNNDFVLPAQFRIGTPTVVAMETGAQYTAFAEVPWNLRRILEYDGQAPGVTVDRLDYELIYGLSCDVSQPFIRLAEVFALLGGIPGRLPEILAAQDPRFDANVYRKWRGQWANLHQRYQSRLAILEPWDSHVSGSLTLKHGMSCLIRYDVNLAQPMCTQTLGKALTQFAPDDSTDGKPFRLPYADLDDPITPTPRTPTAPLRGGVTWGFESRNIFCATLSNEFSTADSAAVSSLDMTALGGFGHQQASFDSGRTSIFADVAMSRTYHYRLERVGRLGVLWNKAKHVIVYERSVVPSRQFYLEQDDPTAPTSTYEVPILRKVQEYVEILEEQRAFPDDHQVATASPTPAPANATPAQRCGCIAGTVFQKGARFPVSSSWGSDVYSNRDGSGTAIGWKIPLWKRDAQPADVYPFPKITLSVMSNFGGTSKESPCDVANPENVYFYTDTRPNTGSDSDQWGAIVGIDTIDLAPLKPPQPSGGTSTLPAVGDVAIPAGFSPCTFTLLPPLQPADIVASRNGPPMAAVLDSVTMMRGYVGQNPSTAEKLAPVLTAYSGAWEKELNALGPSDWNKANLQAVAGRIASQLTQPLSDIQLNVTKAWAHWQDRVNAYNASSVGRFINQLLTASDDGKTIIGGLNQVKQDVTAALNSIPDDPANLRQLVDEQFAQIQQAVISASASPGGLSLLLQQYYRAATGIVSTATTGIKNLQSAGSATLVELTKQVLDLRTTLESTWQSAGSSSPLPGLTDIGAMLAQVPLQNFVAQYNKLIQDLTNSVSSGDLNTVKKAIAALTGPDASVTNELSRFSQLLQLDRTSTDSTLVTYLDCFRNSLVQVDQTAAGVNNWATKAYQQLVTAAMVNKAAVQKAFEDVQTGIYATFNGELTKLQSSFSDEVATLEGKYQKLYGQGVTQLKDLINAIAVTGAENLGQLTSLLQQALQNLPDDIGLPKNGVIDPSDIATLQQTLLAFRDQQFGQVHQFVDKYLNLIHGSVADVTASTNQYLSLIRAFGDAPVADTLSFLPGKIGYYFQQAGLPTQVDLSPVTSILRQAGNIASDASALLNNALNVMHLQIPTQSLANRLVPFDLSSFKLSDIFPKFGGIDLSGLFRDIDLGENGDKIQITHGTDPQTMSAWVQAKVGAHLDDVPIFDTGDIALRLASADFNGQVKIDVSPQGTQQLASGNVTGDWTLLVMGQQAVTLSGTELLFDSTGNFHFIVDPKNVKLPGVLDFVSQYLTPFLTGNNGLSIQIHGTQINALLSLPIPDVSGVTSGISNLRLSCLLGLGLNDKNQFQLDVGFGLSDPQRPFNIAFFILGGAGYLEATTHLVPATSELSVSVNFGIMASASLAVAFGPISGGVYAFLGITAVFTSGGPGLNLSAVLLMRGQVNLAGIISASVCMQLSVGDQAGKVTGTGSFSISVSICWCFTLNISVDISYSIGSFGGGNHASLELPTSNPVLLAELEPGPLDRMRAREPADWYADPIDDLTNFINDYVAMTPGN